MTLTRSTMLDLGTEAPEFELPDVRTGHQVTLESFESDRALLVMFICRHCPYVQHIEAEIARLGRDYESSALGIVAISANDSDTYPDDRPEALAAFADELDLRFPLLHDASQAVAKAYTAACTPDFFLFDSARRLVYRGQLDGSRPANGKPNDGHDLREAIEAALGEGNMPSRQMPSMGCNIKWKSGNEPAYFGG